MAEGQNPPGWWHTVPGMLTATATIITAVTGLIVALNQIGLFSKKAEKAQPAQLAVDKPMPIAGKWSGQAKESTGTSFRIDVLIRPSCKVSEKCGTISVSHVPCYGEITLKEVNSGDYEFSVSDFDSRSNAKVCTPGAGEHFKLLADGKLSYSTTYSDAIGILERVE